MITPKILSIFAVFALILGAFQSNGDKKPPEYDPNNLPPGEISCGRPSKSAKPCSCMDERSKIHYEAAEKCLLGPNAQFKTCVKSIGPLCATKVSDRDNPNYDVDGYPMPTKCTRSCSKARCECCHT